MAFLAIVHAPTLRGGARLCIADLGQCPEKPPAYLQTGAEVSLRFGTCCPDLARGAISHYDPAADRAVLEIAGAEWTIRRSYDGGVAVPGLVADDWFVIGADS